MLPAERKEAIKDIIKNRRSVSVTTLADELQVSTETVRRDLALLEKEGFVTKTHGGAILRSRVMTSAPHKVLSTILVNNKRALAYGASEFVAPGDCIFMDFSTTVFEMCQFIKDLPLTVVTTSLDVINYFTESSNIHVVCPGGQYNKDTNSFTGIETLSFLSSHSFDKAFLSCRSINLDNGLCDSTELMAEIRSKVILNSTSTYMLMDHTKLNRSSYASICPLDRITGLIVDTPLSDEWISVLDEKQIAHIECPVKE